MKLPRPGLFISLEGPDGSGKTTQSVQLAARLRNEGHEVVSCRDPGGTPEGDRIRSLLLDRSTLAPVMRAEMLLYMASRAQLVDRIILPSLDSGAIVIADRFLLSNMVYQGYAGGLDVEEILAVGRVATAGLMPDFTILIDIDPAVAKQRIGKPRDRIEDRPDEYRRRVREGFRELLPSYPSPSVIIDGSRTPEEVAVDIAREVAHVLGNRPRP